MASTPDYYEAVFVEAGIVTESLTVLVVSGATREEVAAALNVDLATRVDNDPEWDEADATAYAIGEVSGGIIALEHTGYGDPSLTALRGLTLGGKTAAVVRGNIQAHHRFGYVRDGQVVFDDDDYVRIDDRDRMPQELRSLLDTVWFDLSVDEDKDRVYVSPFTTGLVMAETVTGIQFDTSDLHSASESGYFEAPSLTYLEDDIEDSGPA